MTQLDLNFNVVKKCNKCKQDKAAEDFCKGRPECKECRKEYKKAYYEQNREKIKERKKAYRKQNAEKIKERMKAYYEQNAEKIKKYGKAWREQNAEKIKERHKAYREQNREKIKERKKAYRKQNAEKIKDYCKQNRDKIRIYIRNKRKTDLNFRLSDNLRKRVRKVLNGKSKSKKTMDLIGCSVDFLKKHLENQFQPGMSWNNYGNPNGDHSECWHIDHILPCASFDLSDPKQQQKCFHYSNLQPLWAEDNMSKGAKIN
jgi:hypothetical protein